MSGKDKNVYKIYKYEFQHTINFCKVYGLVGNMK